MHQELPLASAPLAKSPELDSPHDPSAGVGAEASDSSLVTRAKSGDLSAFEELASRHERRVFSLAMRMLRNQEDAEDVTQQTFLSAIHHLGSFREESSFGTWLARIASHAALKVIRKKKGLETISLEQATEPEEGYGEIAHPEFIADWKQSPQELVHRNEVRQLIEEALGQLEEKHRNVFLLRDAEGFSVRETADLLGISEANVKVRLLRARLQLRERLTRALGDESSRLEPHRHED